MNETLPSVLAARALACVALAGALTAACSSTSATPSTSSGRATHAATGTSTHSPAAPKKSATTRPAPSPAQVRREAAAAVAALAAKQPRGAISVAAQNLQTGKTFVAGARRGMWTASAYKLFVVEALLLQRGGPLSGYESSDAQIAIENSDNPAGYRLFLDAGGNEGLEAAARRFGMRHTVMGETDPTFTRTSAADFMILARNLVDPHSPLTPAARHYLLSLMSEEEEDQRWGVGAAADKGSDYYSKNGWLSIDDTNPPGETDGGRWAVTSVGLIRVRHQRVAMAVLTQHQPLMGDGVRLVERLARAIAPAVTTN
jgi:hypothetical protein